MKEEDHCVYRRLNQRHTSGTPAAMAIDPVNASVTPNPTPKGSAAKVAVLVRSRRSE